MASAVSISNEALSAIAADSIAKLDETSAAAVECNRHFGNAVTDLLERNEWGFQVRRVVGAGLTNDRPAEWRFAYAKPGDAAKVLRVLPPDEASYPEWGVYQTPIWEAYGPIPFIEINGVVYCNVENATLEFASNGVSISDFPPLFRRAVAIELAARVAYPIKKDRQLRGDMISLSEVMLARAIADDRNRYPHRQQDYVSEAELARAGIGSCR